MSETPIHDWLLPRLASLLDEAVAAGLDRAVVVAVMIDLITQPPFNDMPPAAQETA